jgi:hypothetical protein
VLAEFDSTLRSVSFSKFDPVHGRPAPFQRIRDDSPLVAHRPTGDDRLSLSIDGSRVAMISPDGIIRIIDVRTGDVQQLRMSDPDAQFQAVAWAADGRSMFVTWFKPYESGVERVDLDGTRTVLLRSKQEWFGRPKASPDGKRLALSVLSYPGNAWLLEGF